MTTRQRHNSCIVSDFSKRYLILASTIGWHCGKNKERFLMNLKYYWSKRYLKYYLVLKILILKKIAFTIYCGLSFYNVQGNGSFLMIPWMRVLVLLKMLKVEDTYSK